MDAADIMFKMAEAYANCQTYEDRGIVRHFVAAEGASGDAAPVEVHRHRVAFKTYFEKPDKFYFEWAETPVGDPEKASHRISAFWSNGREIMRLFHSQAGAEPCPSLDYVVTAAAGISKGASVTVAAFLLPSLKQKMRSLFRLREVVRLDDTVIDGVDCYYLKGKTWSGGEEELWIDKKEHLIRRTRVAFVIKPGVDEAQMEAIKRFDPKQAEEYRKFREAQKEERRFWNQLDYHQASVNEPLPPGAFEYDPQEESDLIPSFAVL